MYLKLKPDNEIAPLVKEFNQFLEENNLFTTYQITPYIDQYPLHLTLYMASFHEEQIPLIIKEAEKLAQQHQPISLLTSRFISNHNGYVMLSVTNGAEVQGLSNQALKALANLRDKKALIPAWAAHDMGRKLLFNQYGSPSILNYFQPHFSIFSITHLSKEDSKHLYENLQQLIKQFDKNHHIQIRTTAYSIGVGIANEQGQIIKELTSFSLEQNKSS